MKKYYAVKKGRVKGVYLSWEECQQQVSGYSGAEYKKFVDKSKAYRYIENENECKNIDQSGIVDIIAYVDGSYNVETKEYGYGCILIKDSKIVTSFYDKGNDDKYKAMRNVAGEILGCQKAIEYALQQKYDTIAIYYDYEGIEKWARHQWKANKEGTKKYQEFIDFVCNQIDITFVKVLAHSGDTYNEMADSLAKKAVGLK